MITVYSTITCAYCKHVEKFLKSRGVDYEKVMLDDNPTKRQELLDKTGAMTVPITTDGEMYVIGWNVGQLNALITKQMKDEVKGA